ncbi:MAG: hypothetical protein Rubg2KO_27880 [Rubricoccaceae bacterium]
MKHVLPLVLAALLVGCDTTGIEAEPGRFDASLSGAIEGSVTGQAGFAFVNCAWFSFRSDIGRLHIADDCVTSEGQVGPKEGTFAFSPEYLGGYYASYRVEPSGPYYRAVSGEIEIVDRDRTRTWGRFAFEAKPVENGRVVEDGESVFFEGEFNAEGFPVYD